MSAKKALRATKPRTTRNVLFLSHDGKNPPHNIRSQVDLFDFGSALRAAPHRASLHRRASRPEKDRAPLPSALWSTGPPGTGGGGATVRKGKTRSRGSALQMPQARPGLARAGPPGTGQASAGIRRHPVLEWGCLCFRRGDSGRGCTPTNRGGVFDSVAARNHARPNTAAGLSSFFRGLASTDDTSPHHAEPR